MKKFIVIYRAPQSWKDMMKDASPEDSKKEMDLWMNWAKKSGKGLVDMGSPLGNGHKVTSSGISQSNSNVLGYSILQAKDMNGAKKMLKNHPHLGYNNSCEIAIYESLPMPK